MAYRQYSIKGGGNENTVPVSVNGTRKFITFRKSGWDNAAATYDTQDEEVAMAIETSDLYKRGLITCYGDTVPFGEGKAEAEEADEPKEYPDVTTVSEAKAEKADEPREYPDVTTVAEAEAEEADEPREYPDVTTVAEAKKILSADFGIPYSRMPNAEETKRVAGEYGVRFPGLA